jgi:hypothetical protein
MASEEVVELRMNEWRQQKRTGSLPHEISVLACASIQLYQHHLRVNVGHGPGVPANCGIGAVVRKENK